MLNKSVKGKLNRDTNIKYNNLSRGTETGKTSLTLQKLSNGLFSSCADNLSFVLHHLWNSIYLNNLQTKVPFTNERAIVVF